MSQDVIGSPQIGTTTNGTAGAAEATSNDAHLVVIIGQTTSADDVKLTLTYLNASLVQIGQPIKEHLTDIVNSVRHKQFEKSHYDQQQRIGYSNDVNFTFELLVNPLVRSVRQSLVNVATSPRKHKFVVNLSGDRSCQGDVNCADASLACDDFLTLLANPLEVNDEQRKQLKQAPHKLTLLMPARVVDGNRAWKQALERQYAGVSVQSIVVVNNNTSPTSVLPENVELNEALTPLLNQTSVDQLMQSSRHTGTLKMTRPALYIFPSLQGDSAYFALNGYSMLINGGYDRLKPCFWKFVNMLQQIDSVLVTHADVDSLGGLAAFFAKKAAEPDCKPSVLTLLGNLVHSNNKYAQQAAQLINAELAAGPGVKLTPQTDVDLILEAIDKLKIKLLPLFKNNESLLLPFNKSQNAQNKYEHINLYSKLGHGSLDLYVLSPYVNSSEYKEFYQQQQQNFARQTTASANMQKSHLAVHGVFKQLPLSHLASAVCLLVWLPAPAPRGSTESNQALRLLFTGNAPQHVIINALEKVKEFELLSEPVYRVKPEPAQHQPAQQQQSMKKQVSSSTTGAAKENGHHGGGGGSSKLNTSISNKPVGTANGHHNETESSKPTTTTSSNKPPVPTQSSGKPQSTTSNKPPKPTTSASSATSSNSGVALNASSSGQSKEVKKSTEKTTTTTTSTNKEAAVKKKPPTGGDHDHEKHEGKSVGKDGEKPPVGEKKKPAVPKRESTSSNGQAVKPSHSDTNAAASGSAPTRSSLSSHTVNNGTGATSKSETTSKPEPKPAVPKQKQPASKPAATAAATEKSETSKPTATKPETKKPTTTTTKTDKSVPQSVKKPAEKTSGTKTLTLSMEGVGGGGGAVLKGGVTAAAVPAVSAAAPAASPFQEPTPPVEPNDVVIQQQQQQQQQQPASVESIETAMHNEEEAKHDDHRQRQEDEVVVQHVEHVEQIEKIEQVMSVEQVVEEIIPAAPSTPVLPTAETIQQEMMNGGSGDNGNSNNNYFGHHESPNLSPVKKEFGALNHSSVESTGPSEVAVVDEGGVVHEEAPVVEEQLTSEAVTTGEIEIVSGNLNGESAESAVELLMRPADDVMTRSFIEDDACPGSNPFAAPVLQPTPVRNNNGPDAASSTNGGNHLNESCDLNRTHELFDGDESSSSINTAPANTNGNGVEETNGVKTNGNGHGGAVDDLDDKIISGLEALKLANQQQQAGGHNGEEYNGNNNTNGNGVVGQEEPRNWNLLELPKPVNPADHIVPADVSDKVEIDAKPDLTSSPAATSGGPSSTLAGSDKKPTSINGKSKPSAGRPSVDASSKQPQQSTTTTTTTTTAANNTTSTTTTKATGRPVPPIHPAYVELTYVPAHGSEHHVDAEFFKRVRARHYVLSALEPSEHVLNALCEGKEVWEDKQLQVTLIPTYETDALRKWYVQNEERLARLKIDVSPAACHATITMDDNPELTCQVYKLEF